jgi:hypothetical protein
MTDAAILMRPVCYATGQGFFCRAQRYFLNTCAVMHVAWRNECIDMAALAS